MHELQNVSAMLSVHECMTCCYVCLSRADNAFKGRFGKVYLKRPPLSTVVKLLCLHRVTEVECKDIQGCKVSISVRCNDDSCMQASAKPYMCKVTSQFVSISVADVPRCVATYTITGPLYLETANMAAKFAPF